MRILSVGTDNAVAAYDATARRLVIVAVNKGAAQNTTFDLSGFTTVTGGSGGLIPRWTTSTTSGTDRYTARSDTHLSGKTFRSSFAAGAVQTFQIDGVSI
jgi:galactan endo-1,6-beta-galactosidase